jgi:PEGA domain-containing protein/FecR-like protein/tetratricopeptide repeat protein
VSSEPIHNGGPTEEALFAWRAGRLHPEAAEWIGDHVDGCRRCRTAMDHIDAVHELLEPPPEPPFLRQRQIADVRRRLEERPTRHVPWRQMRWAALFGAVAGFAVVFALHPHRPLPVGDGVGFAVVSRQGAADVEVGDDHAVAEAKMALPSGGWLTVAPSSRVVATWAGARVAVEGGPTGARVQLSESRAMLRKLKLERGRVVLDVEPLAPGAELAVQTNDSRVTVHGTRFLVEASPGGTSVAVDRGRVRVAGARTLDVAAGLQIIAGSAQTMPLGVDFAARLAALDGAMASGPTESLDVFANVADAAVSIDGVEYGRAPLSLALAPGAHTVHVRAEGRLPVEERVEIAAGTPTLFHAELPELPSVEEPEAQPAVPSRPGASELLSRARADVLAGAYDHAIARLVELEHGPASKLQLARAALLQAQAERLARRPERALPLLQATAAGDGPEAEQAQFLLAQTLGRDLHDPERAAAAYEASERRFARGIFTEEAALRRGEALLAAGDTREGVEALERYLRQYPTAPHVDDAHLSIASARRDRLGDCAGAVPHLRAVADGRGPRAELALIGEARCLRTLGRGDEARGAYQKYLHVQPHGRYADEARLGATGSAKLIP